VRSLSSGGITDRSANPTHLGAEGTSVFGMGYIYYLSAGVLTPTCPGLMVVLLTHLLTHP